MKKTLLFIASFLIVINTYSQSFQLLKDISPSTYYGASNTIVKFYEYNAKVYFAISNGTINGVYSTDGTANGTVLLSNTASYQSSYSDITYKGSFIGLGSNVYFTASDPTNGEELWVTDGTPTGTQLFKDINPGVANSNILIHGVVNNKLVFWADDGVNGAKLWVTDGTLAGTFILSNTAFYAGYIPTREDNHVTNGFMYFFASSSAGTEPWKTDGTIAGTSMIKDINIGTGASGLQETNKFISYNNKMYFSATSSNAAVSSELWETDGTANGTQLAVDIYPGGIGSRIRDMITFNNKIYLVADKLGMSNGKFSLISTDGTPSGTVVIDTVFKPNVTHFPKLTVFNNEIYLMDKYQNTTNQLFKLNSNNELVVIESLSGVPMAGLVAGSYSYFEEYDNKLWFVASSNASYSYIWNTDGTTVGTQQITPVNGSEYFGGYRNNLKSTSLGLFTVGFTAAYGIEVWIYKSTATSINENKNQQFNFSVYPNPAKEILYIKLNNELLALQSSIKITNLLGENIISEIITSNNFTINTNNLKNGVYFVTIENKDVKSTQKIIIE